MWWLTSCVGSTVFPEQVVCKCTRWQIHTNYTQNLHTRSTLLPVVSHPTRSARLPAKYSWCCNFQDGRIHYTVKSTSTIVTGVSSCICPASHELDLTAHMQGTEDCGPSFQRFASAPNWTIRLVLKDTKQLEQLLTHGLATGVLAASTPLLLQALQIAAGNQLMLATTCKNFTVFRHMCMSSICKLIGYRDNPALWYP